MDCLLISTHVFELVVCLVLYVVNYFSAELAELIVLLVETCLCACLCTRMAQIAITGRRDF